MFGGIIILGETWGSNCPVEESFVLVISSQIRLGSVLSAKLEIKRTTYSKSNLYSNS
jgi:hypothetical protein